jgi:hypothetical protein
MEHPVNQPAPVLDVDTVREIAEEMRESDADWQRTLAFYTGADGAIDPQLHADYEKAKLDYGWDLVGSLTDWSARLTAALDAPHTP